MSAACLLGLAAALPARLSVGQVQGLGAGGDGVALPPALAAYLQVLRQLGCTAQVDAEHGLVVTGTPRLRAGTFAMGACAEQVPTVAILAALADGPSRIVGVGRLRFHECDRLAVMAQGLRQVGAQAQVLADGLSILPPAAGRAGLHSATIHCHGDHRVAMAFALLAAAVGPLTLDDGGAVSKSWPGFFVQLGALGVPCRWLRPCGPSMGA